MINNLLHKSLQVVYNRLQQIEFIDMNLKKNVLFRIDMRENISKLINDIESGNEFEAFEAAKSISQNELRKKEIDALSKIATNGIETHNQHAAVYALSFIDNNASALNILIQILDSKDIHESVRGQAAEGIGLVGLTRSLKRNKFKKDMEAVLLKCLKDPSPEVRFWSCYAVGTMQLKKALPILQDLKENDKAVCPGWWYVSEEAEDAIEWINGRSGKDRIPVRNRK